MYTAWAGADRAWEYIFEEYMEVKYELYGPEGWEEDYIEALKEEDRWEEALAEWEPPKKCREKELEVMEDCLLWAMKQCQKASNYYRKQYGAPLI